MEEMQLDCRKSPCPGPLNSLFKKIETNITSENRLPFKLMVRRIEPVGVGD